MVVQHRGSNAASKPSNATSLAQTDCSHSQRRWWRGYGYVVTGAQLVRFVGYKSKLTINLSAGTVLLDATADIDGVSHVVPWRVQAEMPKRLAMTTLK